MKSRSIFQICAALVLLAAAWISSPPSTTRADIGWPPLSPGGSSLEAPQGVDTNVRMLAEEVNLTIESFERPVPAGGEQSPAYHMRALVEAVFTMRNLGTADEAFDVWFPLAASLRYPGMLPYTPENIVSDFKVWVDGQPTATEQVQAPDVSDPAQQSAWARFGMTFPAGKDVTVRVNYTLYPSGRRPFGGFEYILQTGAGWKDSIGKAVINVYLPDTVTAESVSLSGKSIEGLPIAPQPTGYSIENNVIHWELTDLEPGAKDNIYVDVLEPERYRALVRARAQAANSPDSADAQLELANAIQGAVMIVKSVGQHGGGVTLADQANVAYRRALELAPQRAEIYAEYARWLMRTGGWSSLMFKGVCPPELCDLVSRGLSLFPENADLIQINAEIQSLQTEAAPYATQAALDQTATADGAARQATQQALSATSTAAALQPSATSITPTGKPLFTPTVTPTPARGLTGFEPFIWLPLALVALVFMLISIRQRPNRS
ncbi:hypothetical protein LARV_00769 [Longilinea arvoryzae]|uniref:Uncharacterized protein n=1 Tax=Longilinea arvoryzae TaxID=360412 RepID=A0A0S7BDY8_9CHLR|nr:hypothetical protein [Longilinea arvoryzae]GAP13028.1 hypothetical protein LARV_00769 [Longilinea arvoryzae]